MREGLVLASRYRLDALLGEGGMGQVSRGLDLDLDRPVAVKLMLDSARDDLRARFRREGRAANRAAYGRNPFDALHGQQASFAGQPYRGEL